MEKPESTTAPVKWGWSKQVGQPPRVVFSAPLSLDGGFPDQVPIIGDETWLDLDGNCATTIAEIEDTGIPERIQLRILFLRALPYEEYLRSPHWQAVRIAVIKVQDGKCGLCPGCIRDIHHKPGGYKRKGFERPEDVIGLCRPCHEIEHDMLVARLREEARKISHL